MAKVAQQVEAIVLASTKRWTIENLALEIGCSKEPVRLALVELHRAGRVVREYDGHCWNEYVFFRKPPDTISGGEVAESVLASMGPVIVDDGSREWEAIPLKYAGRVIGTCSVTLIDGTFYIEGEVTDMSFHGEVPYG